MPDGITVMHDNLNARDSLLAPICDLIVLPHGCKASLDTSEMIDTLPILSVFGVKMLPVIINPDSSKSINYSATFTSATIEEVYEMPLNEHKINLIKSLVVNPNTVSSTLRKISIDTNVPEGYLIITHKQFNKAASQLAHNKRLLGYNVKICSGENWTPYKIRQCVKKVCREIPNITYLCLLGGYAHLPAYFSDVGQMSERPYPTDQFFGCINDSLSLFPDIQIGRISVIDPQTALNVVQKLADYEFEPNFPERFYNTATYATYFEGVAPDYEKEKDPFGEYIERNALHIANNHNGNVQRFYSVDSISNPKYWKSGTEIPEYLRRPNFEWHSSRLDFDKAMNTSGKYLICYTHGNEKGWQMLNIDNEYIGTLSNKQLPLVISISCSTGRFSPDAVGGCFAQNFLNNPNGGAIGVIAATDEFPISKGCIPLIFAFTNTIWGTPTVNDGESNCYLDKTNTFGAIINNAVGGALNSITLLNAISIRRKLMLFGDPAMQLRNKMPHKIECTATRDNSFTSKFNCFVKGDIAPSKITIVDRYKGDLISLPAGTTEFQYETEHPEFVSFCAYSPESIPGVCNLDDPTNSIMIDGVEDNEIGKNYRSVIVGDSFNKNGTNVILSNKTSVHAKEFIILPNTEIPADANVELIIE